MYEFKCDFKNFGSIVSYLVGVLCLSAVYVPFPSFFSLFSKGTIPMLCQHYFGTFSDPPTHRYFQHKYSPERQQKWPSLLIFSTVFMLGQWVGGQFWVGQKKSKNMLTQYRDGPFAEERKERRKRNVNGRGHPLSTTQWNQSF